MWEFYETVMREQQWREDGCPEPSAPPPCNISESELRQIFGTGFLPELPELQAA